MEYRCKMRKSLFEAINLLRQPSEMKETLSYTAANELLGSTRQTHSEIG